MCVTKKTNQQMSNQLLVKNVCEEDFSGVWLSWVMLGWDQGPNLT